MGDAQLLRRFLGFRDEAAFTAIVQRYGTMVWGLCVRQLGETPEAEDAFQATFLILVRKAPSLPRAGTARALVVRRCPAARPSRPVDERPGESSASESYWKMPAP